MHTPGEYSAVFALRRVMRTACFDLLRGEGGSPSEVAASSRLGLVIPKRLVRHATLRNSIKRQVREAFRLRCRLLPKVDIVVRLTRWPRDVAALAADLPAMKRLLRLEIESLLEKLERQAVDRQTG